MHTTAITVVEYDLGAVWYVAVVALHVLVAVAGSTHVGVWGASVVAASLTWRVWSALRDGPWRFHIGADGVRLVRGRRVYPPRSVWMSQNLVVIGTSRRTLPITPKSIGDQEFVRLRRALRRTSVTG